MINSDLKKLIESNALALATTNNNKPHCVAVGFVKVVDEDKLLITNNCMTDTIENIKSNPDVAITVWTRNWEEFCEGFELIGTAEYFTDGDWLYEVKKLQENEGEACKGALLITVKEVKKLA